MRALTIAPLFTLIGCIFVVEPNDLPADDSGVDDAEQALSLTFEGELSTEQIAEIPAFPAVLVATVEVEQVDGDTFQALSQPIAAFCDAEDAVAPISATLDAAFGPCRAADVSVSLTIATVDPELDCATPLDEIGYAHTDDVLLSDDVTSLPAACGAYDVTFSFAL